MHDGVCRNGIDDVSGNDGVWFGAGDGDVAQADVEIGLFMGWGPTMIGRDR